MNSQRMRNKWTEENISYLKEAYLQGFPLKQIAAKLDRSVSAINKVLARYKLRTHSKMTPHPSLSRPTARQLKQKRDLGTQIRKKNKKKNPLFCPDYRQWVLFECVVRWMETEGMSIVKSEFDVYYEVDGYPKNKAQILYIANKRREQLQLPIFFVRGVTNS